MKSNPPELSQSFCDAIVRNLATIYSWRSFSYTIRQIAGSSIRGSFPVGRDESAAPIGCCAKAFTALAVTDALNGRGLSLECPVTEIVPEFGIANDIEGRQITVAHLISHASGMDTEGLIGFPAPQDAFWPRLRRVDQLFSAGKGHSYCSVGFTVAAHVAERLTGKLWEELLTTIPAGPGNSRVDLLPLVTSNDALPASRSSAQTCTNASFGTHLLLTTDELAEFGIRCLSPVYSSVRDLMLWPDDDIGYCVCGTVEDVNTRLQVVPSTGLALAARIEGSDGRDVAALHDFFRQLIGSQWNGFIKPRVRTDREATLRLVGSRYRCAFLDVSLHAYDGEFYGDLWAGVDGENSWVGASRKHEQVRLLLSDSGVLSGNISVGPDPFPFILEPLTYDDGVQYLIFNRTMLLRRVP